MKIPMQMGGVVETDTYTNNGVSVTARKCGKIVSLQFYGVTTNATASGSAIFSIDNLASKYRPSIQTYEIAPYSYSDGTKNLYYNVYSDGKIRIMNYTQASFPANTNISGHLMTYITN